MQSLKWLMNLLIKLITGGDEEAEDLSLVTQIRRALLRPLLKMSEVQKKKLMEGEELCVSITDPIIKTVIGKGNYESMAQILQIVDDLGKEVKFQLQIFPDLHNLETEYFMIVNLYPNDNAFDFEEVKDDDPTADLIAPEPVVVPLKAMAAGAGKRY